MGRRRAGPEDSVPFREGRQVPGARAAAPRDGRQRRGRGRQGGWEADAPGGSGLRAAREGPCRQPALWLWLRQARRGRLGVGGGPAPGRGPPSAYHGWREARGSGRGARAAAAGGRRAARGWLGAAEAAGEGALALPRWPLLSVCVCSKMAARLAPRDADAGPQGRPLRRRRLPPRPGRLRPTRPRRLSARPAGAACAPAAPSPPAPRHVTREPGWSRDAGLAAVRGGGAPGVLPGCPLTRDARPSWRPPLVTSPASEQSVGFLQEARRC